LSHILAFKPISITGGIGRQTQQRILKKAGPERGLDVKALRRKQVTGKCHVRQKVENHGTKTRHVARPSKVMKEKIH